MALHTYVQEPMCVFSSIDFIIKSGCFLSCFWLAKHRTMEISKCIQIKKNLYEMKYTWQILSNKHVHIYVSCYKLVQVDFQTSHILFAKNINFAAIFVKQLACLYSDHEIIHVSSLSRITPTTAQIRSWNNLEHFQPMNRNPRFQIIKTNQSKR